LPPPLASRGGAFFGNFHHPIFYKNAAKKRRNDVILIVSLLLSLSLIGALLLLFSKEGDTVIVTVDGAVFGEYPLCEDRVVEIRTNSTLNILVIRDGRAHIREASCPDGICAAHKPISRQGESIVCLPHRVVVTVQCTEQQNAPDIVT
jgi:hypothetical protein